MCTILDPVSNSQRPPGAARVRAADVAERATATRAALIAAARRLFAEKGYFDTGNEEIVAEAGAGTRGALYHHFADKRALFVAVHDQLQAELLADASAQAQGDALSRLRGGVIGLLEASRTPEIQRIVLIDGPVVLGTVERRDTDERYGLATMRGLLKRAVAEGTVPALPIDAMSHMLLSASRDAARYVAEADDPDQARRDAIIAVDLLLDGLARR
jgi:AcrR family transcriptional regulator